MADRTENRKALVIEDESSISTLCTRILRDIGFHAEVVQDGKSAKETASTYDYSLILLDIKLPVISGYDFFVWLKQENPIVSKRVIFMTGSVLGVNTKNLLENSGQPYLLKPFRPGDLKNIVLELLNTVR